MFQTSRGDLNTSEHQYLSWTAGNAHDVFGVESWQSFRLLLVGEERVKVLEFIVTAPAVHLSILGEG